MSGVGATPTTGAVSPAPTPEPSNGASPNRKTPSSVPSSQEGDTLLADADGLFLTVDLEHFAERGTRPPDPKESAATALVLVCRQRDGKGHGR